MSGINGEPTRQYEIPLWETNHSRERLLIEERADWIAYRLGYEMSATAVDPDLVAYKYFSKDQFPDGNVTEMDFTKSQGVALMCDFNRNPQSAALGQRMGDKYLVFDEIVNDNALTSEQGQHIVKALQGWGIDHVTLFGDNTSNQGGKSYGRTGRNDWSYIKEALQEAGITFKSRLRQQNPKRKVRVDKVNNIIYNPLSEERRFMVHKRCNKVIRDYSESITDDEGLKTDNGKIGHVSDAIDYWIYECETGGSKFTFVGF